MDRDSKSENRRFYVFDFSPRRSPVGRFENPIVMLHPENLGISSALHEAVHVLNVVIGLIFFRLILGAHSRTGRVPGFSAIASDPDAAGGNADADVLRVA